VIPDRLVSLADPDAGPIRKGKPRAPTQFGYTLLVAEDERGFVADHQLQQGNPPDAPNWCRRSSGSSRSPAGRPGWWSATVGSAPPAANDQALEALGVKHIGLQRTGTPSQGPAGGGADSAVPAAAQRAGRD
jgi:IS5 family transposase